MARKRFPTIWVKGHPYDRGHQHGSEAKALIETNLKTYMKLFKYYSGFDRSLVMREAKKFIPTISKYDSEITEEIRGIADGAQRNFEEIVALNARYELVYTAWTECTSLCTMNEATASKGTIIGQNWDWSIFVRDSCIVLQAKQDGKPDVTTFTEAGMVGKIGLNSEGIALCVNGLVSDKDRSRPSVPFHVVCRRILDSKTMSDAMGAVLQAQRSCSANYMIAHVDGEAIDLETRPGDTDCLYPDGGILVHANHFISPRFNLRDSGKKRFPDTLLRDRRAKNLLIRKYGNIDVEVIQRVLRDHFNYPNSICKHLDERIPENEREETVASIVMNLNEKKMFVSSGPPCENEYAGILTKAR